jgi:hypothetical protein
MGSDLSWELVDAIGRSPILQAAHVPTGIELAEVERLLLAADDMDAVERERLLVAVRELADFAASR